MMSAVLPLVVRITIHGRLGIPIVIERWIHLLNRDKTKFIECERVTQRKSKRPIEHFDAIFCSSLFWHFFARIASLLHSSDIENAAID
jgi:hypothetical protein